MDYFSHGIRACNHVECGKTCTLGTNELARLMRWIKRLNCELSVRLDGPTHRPDVRLDGPTHLTYVLKKPPNYLTYGWRNHSPIRRTFWWTLSPIRCTFDEQLGLIVLEVATSRPILLNTVVRKFRRDPLSESEQRAKRLSAKICRNLYKSLLITP